MSFEHIFAPKGGYRVRVNKPLQAVGMSADNEDNLSAKDIISRHASKPETGLFIL